MGKSEEKIVDRKFILPEELFTNQMCPKCGYYLSISRGDGYFTDGVLLTLVCLKEDCDYVSQRELLCK